MTWDAELRLAESAARAAARLLQTDFAADAKVQQQDGRDIKTRADIEAEACILQHLQTSGLPVLAEESATTAAASGVRWLVDPLDGTMNFSRRFPVCAVSIGLWDHDQPVLGATYDLGHHTLYTGIVGRGAWRDEAPVHVSTTSERAQAILATGFPTGRDFGREALDQFIGRIQSFKKIRMIGSAALSLARVAEGAFDAYCEENIMLWDVAAGLALVAAAGGRIQVAPGSRPHSVLATATNGLMSL